MKTFEDLVFGPHPQVVALKETYKEMGCKGSCWGAWFKATQARMDFPNGYGISVLRGEQFYSNGKDTYEVGVFYRGRLIRYFEHDSVLGWQNKKQVTEIMKEVQELKE